MELQQPADTAQRLYVLYHEIRATDYSYAIDADAFDKHVGCYARWRRERPGSVWPEVTFDDGHISNAEVAAPILATHGLKAQFFITAGWTGAKAGYMGWAEVRALYGAGHSIGAHGWSHKLLTHCSDAELSDELHRSRLTLEDGIGASIAAMSLPGGRYDRRVLEACRAAGYARVYTSVPEIAGNPASFLAGRVNIKGDMQPEWIVSLLFPDSPTLKKLRRSYRTKAAIQALLGDTLYARLWARLNRSGPDSDPERGAIS